MIEIYLNSQRERYAPTTLNVARSWLEHLRRHLGRELQDCNRDQLEQWHKELLWRPGPSGKNYSQATVNQAVGVVRNFFRWALSEGHIERDPAACLKMKSTRNPRPTLSTKQARKLLETADPTCLIGSRNRAVLGLLIETRASRAACSRLDCGHLQLDTGALLTHGRKRRLHCLSAGLLQDLQTYLEFSRPSLAAPREKALLVTQKGGRLSPHSINQIARNHARLAGVPRP